MKKLLYLAVTILMLFAPADVEAKPRTVIKVNQLSCVVGSWIRISGRITRADTGLSPGVLPIECKLAGRYIGTKNCDARGYFDFDLNITEEFFPRTTTATAEFDGDKYFGSSFGSAKAIIYRGYSQLNVTTASGKVGSTVKLSATLKCKSKYKDGSQARIGNRQLVFEVDGRNVGNPETDENGVAEVKYKIKEPGAHVLKVTFRDYDRNYAGSWASAGFTGIR